MPKFYRDCFEQGVIAADRRTLLERMFFSSSSPLRTEADNWFLRELRGRYDLVLRYVARHPGCTHADILAHANSGSPSLLKRVSTTDKHNVKAAVERVLRWNFERLIMAHGSIIEQNGKEMFIQGFEQFFGKPMALSP